jgi:hypothetical protein
MCLLFKFFRGQDEVIWDYGEFIKDEEVRREVGDK